MSKKLNISKEELYELYIVQNLSQEQVAIKCGCGRKDICILLKKYNIKKDTSIPYKKLYDLYITQNLNQEQVAIKCGYSVPILRKYLKKYNIVKSIKQILESRKQTCKERLGVENPAQSEEIKKKREKTNLKRFARKNPKQKHISLDKIEIYSDKNNLINYLNSIDYEKRTSIFCSKDLGISKPEFNRYIIKYNIFNLVNHTKSEWENEAKRWFESKYINLKVSYNNKIIKNPNTNRYLELDIFIPDFNLAIELNGSYWHSDKFIQKNKHMSAEEYHNLKEQLCKEQGITLYTIWDYDLTENNTLEECLERIIHNTLYNLIYL